MRLKEEALIRKETKKIKRGNSKMLKKFGGSILGGLANMARYNVLR